MTFSKLSIVIPAYNEGATIHLILDRVKAVTLPNDIEKEVLLINDCSTDNTEESILAYKKANPDIDISYYKHEINKGKGAALQERRFHFQGAQQGTAHQDPHHQPEQDRGAQGGASPL